MKMTSFLPRLVGVESVKLIRSFRRSYSWDGSSYDGPGKTTVTILNKDPDFGLMVDKMNSAGFGLNNGLWILGPMILFPRSVLGWNIKSSEDISEESLALFDVMEPTPDILIVGLDKKYDTGKTPFIPLLRKFATRKHMSIEILPVLRACTTFNFLNAENRFAGALLMPPAVELPDTLQAIGGAALRRSLHKLDNRELLHQPDRPEQPKKPVTPQIESK